MKLPKLETLTEATSGMHLDDEFSRNVGKIQAAIEKLEMLATAFTKAEHWPVASQVRQLERASKDLDKLALHFQSLR